MPPAFAQPDMTAPYIAVTAIPGREALRRSLPVIAVTTLADDSEAQRLKQAGFSDVISKPIDPVNFAAQVSRWLK